MGIRLTTDERDARNRTGDYWGWVYQALRIVLAPPIDWLFRTRLEGSEHVPATGGAVIAPTHRSNWDSPALGLALPRNVRFMAKAELYRLLPLGWVLRHGGAFKVERGTGDARAVVMARRLAKEGDLIAIFPEGTRNRSGGPVSLHAGAARIALAAGVPLIPVLILGTDRVRLLPPRFPRFVVRVGPPVPLDDLPDDARGAATEVTERWVRAIEALREAG